MLGYLMMFHQIIQFPLRSYNALVNIHDIIVMPKTSQIFYVFKVYHIKVRPLLVPIPPLPSNSLSSHFGTADSHHKRLYTKQLNTNHLWISSVKKDGQLPLDSDHSKCARNNTHSVHDSSI